MRLIGMLDSPYVRRVAISLKILQLPFSHDSISVFRGFDSFSTINPVVKAPTLVTDDGVVLMDSTLILEYAARLADPMRHLDPVDLGTYSRAQRIVGLALAACEKTAQIVYERDLRPPEKQHQPWLDRVHGQLAAAYRLLERECDGTHQWFFGERMLQADISAAVAWRFSVEMLPGVLGSETHPFMDALSVRAEGTDVFQSTPFA